MIIRPMLEQDIDYVAMVHSDAFKRQLASRQWVTCNYKCYPRIMIYVAVNDMHQIVGFIQWIQKSGFRKESVMELEQIAVLTKFQDQQIGTMLIMQSLELVKKYLLSQNSMLKAVIVTTRADNYAQRLYEKALNAKITACIKDLYSSDEVVMIAKL